MLVKCIVIILYLISKLITCRLDNQIANPTFAQKYFNNFNKDNHISNLQAHIVKTIKQV